MTNFQREGAVSNAHVGREFEQLAKEVLHSMGVSLEVNFSVPVGIGNRKKPHEFDLGSEVPKVIVECKSHRWTKGNNVPSAKMTVWNEAMYYFSVSPPGYRKIFFVLKDARISSKETLAEYYIRINRHLIPTDVEIWEFDNETTQVKILMTNS